MTEPQYLLDKPPQTRRVRRSEDELLRYLRQACRQISEFRRMCDPGENVVLVTPVEMMGAQAFNDGTEDDD